MIQRLARCFLMPSPLQDERIRTARLDRPVLAGRRVCPETADTCSLLRVMSHDRLSNTLAAVAVMP
jgi:hypothetical protein